ncbi:unnamed protein product [Soboliphyme baturini]|uniref:Cleavage and polyadenylation specificity factor subunit 6 n=1 Tax=Soboliphyme baturini TaxID=241478 RepID=A0A183IN63_9BILA|nr:unnamed protein product [Soboliphyme baturini]
MIVEYIIVGNLTWWTTDQDLADAVASINVTDLVDIKFYENRANGQSKGQCMERLSTRQLHGQTPVVMPYNKQSLNQFEAATRKPGEKPPPKAGYTEKQGTPVFLGTIRIGAGGSSSTPVGGIISSGQPLRNGRSVAYRPGCQSMSGAMSLPAPMMLSGRHRNSVPVSVPPGAAPVVVPPPTPNRPPPGFPPTIRPVGPPPAPGLPPPGVPPPGSHVNPNFYPGLVSAATHGGPAMGGEHPLSDAEFEEVMNRNRTVSSSAISRAVSDAAAGDFASAIETLVTAISLIRQSRVSYDDRCKILISSLQDTLHGIEAKSYGRRSKDRSRDRSRSRERRSKRRERSRTRSRSRERYLGDYSPRRRRY